MRCKALIEYFEEETTMVAFTTKKWGEKEERKNIIYNIFICNSGFPYTCQQSSLKSNGKKNLFKILILFLLLHSLHQILCLHVCIQKYGLTDFVSKTLYKSIDMLFYKRSAMKNLISLQNAHLHCK